MPEEKIHHRVRIDMTKVDHFVEFINHPYFYQDVSYGTKFRHSLTLNLPTPTNTSLSILTTLLAIKKSVAKTLLRRADCLPSSLDSKAEERKYVANVLKANGYTKTFLRNCQKPVTNSNALNEREPATGFAVIPYIQGVTESCSKTFSDFGAYFRQT